MSPEILVTTGMLMCIFGLGWASTFDAATSMLTIYAVLALMGTGVALFVSPNMKMIMRSVEPRHYGIASAVTGQMRIVGMTVSMVAISMMISIVVGDRVLDVDTFPLFNRAMRFILFGGCAMGALGMCVSILAPVWKRKARRKTLQGDTDA